MEQPRLPVQAKAAQPVVPLGVQFGQPGRVSTAEFCLLGDFLKSGIAEDKHRFGEFHLQLRRIGVELQLLNLERQGGREGKSPLSPESRLQHAPVHGLREPQRAAAQKDPTLITVNHQPVDPHYLLRVKGWLGQLLPGGLWVRLLGGGGERAGPKNRKPKDQTGKKSAISHFITLLKIRLPGGSLPTLALFSPVRGCLASRIGAFAGASSPV